jgi:predicted nucleic acid-binding protein
MASEPPVVVYDACVLYPFHLRNLLVQIAVEGLVVARWTDAIHDEWIRNLVNSGRVTRQRLEVTRDLMKAVLPEADVRDYARHEAGLDLPDPDDRHVLAAAIAARASVIVTWNVRHFPARQMARYDVVARDPDRFLVALHDGDPDVVAAVVEAARTNLRRSAPTAAAYRRSLEKQGLTTFVARLRAAGRRPPPKP